LIRSGILFGARKGPSGKGAQSRKGTRSNGPETATQQFECQQAYHATKT
jgi:hypothetical protein